MKNKVFLLSIFVVSLSLGLTLDAMKKRKALFKPVTIDLVDDEEEAFLDKPNNQSKNNHFIDLTDDENSSEDHHSQKAQKRIRNNQNNNPQVDQEEALRFLRNTIALENATLHEIQQILSFLEPTENEIEEIQTIRNLAQDVDTIDMLRNALDIQPVKNHNYVHQEINNNHNNQEETGECAICTDDVALIKLECGHKTACKDCLEDSLRPGIREKNSATWKCTTQGCNHALTEKDLQKISPELYSQCLEIINKNYIDSIQNIKQCPTPNCPYQFENDNNLQQLITCPGCDATYCSACLVNHDPNISCEEHRNNVEQEQTNQEILRNNPNIKKCPNPRGCQALIDKNEGCKHMTCTMCKYHWCWDCEQEFKIKPDNISKQEGRRLGYHANYYRCEYANARQPEPIVRNNVHPQMNPRRQQDNNQNQPNNQNAFVPAVRRLFNNYVYQPGMGIVRWFRGDR